MAWTQLTSATLRERLGNAEIEALIDESPQPDAKLTELLEQVAQDVLSRVNSGRRKRGLPSLSGTGRYVPPGSTRHAYTLTRRLLTDTFPSLAEYNGEDRRLAVQDAEDYLDSLANNEADSDDSGAATWESPNAGSSFRTGGRSNYDFTAF
mgnify:CR=1 FL=1|tara:strand:- start:762 stop:1214 length:453 start_codon:yes stop_codon:yes gene_type:complete